MTLSLFTFLGTIPMWCPLPKSLYKKNRENRVPVTFFPPPCPIFSWRGAVKIWMCNEVAPTPPLFWKSANCFTMTAFTEIITRPASYLNPTVSDCFFSHSYPDHYHKCCLGWGIREINCYCSLLHWESLKLCRQMMITPPCGYPSGQQAMPFRGSSGKYVNK